MMGLLPGSRLKQVDTMAFFKADCKNYSPDGGQEMIKNIPFTKIDGFLTGHAHDADAATGCSVVISHDGAVAGVDVRGGAPGTRETDLLDPVNLVETVHCVFLAGGSAYGLDAAAGIMAFLEEKSTGFDVQVARVPIVTGAVLFDLSVGSSSIRPDREMGYNACLDTLNNREPSGCTGAGTGASIGKILGMEHAMKSGIGCCAFQVGDLQIGAMVAVNCLGDVVDPSTGQILAGALTPDKSGFSDTETIMIKNWADRKNLFSSNTTIGVVLTNGLFNKAQAKKIASMAQNGYARTLRPAHSMFDGDTVFSMCSGRVTADLSVTGLLAARAMEQAVISAVKHATSMYGLKCHSDLTGL